MNPDIRAIALQHFDKQKLMQLATVGPTGPWTCSVWFGYDTDLNIYFFSATNRRHSIEIASDNRVAGSIAGPYEPDDGKPARAVQFSGTARKLDDPREIADARATYEGRIFDANMIDTLINHPDRPHAFYSIKLNTLVLFDVENFPENSRQELSLR